MTDRTRRLARGSAILLAVLYAVFALDAATISAGSLVRLCAAALVLAGSIRAWSRPRFGAIAFAVAFLASVPLLRTWSAPERFLLLSLPLAVIALLFKALEGRRAGASGRLESARGRPDMA